jgi:hypothetical protein
MEGLVGVKGQSDRHGQAYARGNAVNAHATRRDTQGIQRLTYSTKNGRYRL